MFVTNNKTDSGMKSNYAIKRDRRETSTFK